jgi:hypothetical protein
VAANVRFDGTLPESVFAMSYSTGLAAWFVSCRTRSPWTITSHPLIVTDGSLAAFTAAPAGNATAPAPAATDPKSTAVTSGPFGGKTVAQCGQFRTCRNH